MEGRAPGLPPGAPHYCSSHWTYVHFSVPHLIISYFFQMSRPQGMSGRYPGALATCFRVFLCAFQRGVAYFARVGVQLRIRGGCRACYREVRPLAVIDLINILFRSLLLSFSFFFISLCLFFHTICQYLHTCKACKLNKTPYLFNLFHRSSIIHPYIMLSCTTRMLRQIHLLHVQSFSSLLLSFCCCFCLQFFVLP